MSNSSCNPQTRYSPEDGCGPLHIVSPRTQQAHQGGFGRSAFHLKRETLGPDCFLAGPLLLGSEAGRCDYTHLPPMRLFNPEYA